MDKKLTDYDIREVEKFSKHKLIKELRDLETDELLRFMIKQNFALNKKVSVISLVATIFGVLLVLGIVVQILFTLI